MAIAGGAVPSIRLEINGHLNRLLIKGNGSMSGDMTMTDIDDICDKLLAGEVVIVDATADRVRRVDEELIERGITLESWPW